MKQFDKDNSSLRDQFKNINWIKESGVDEEALRRLVSQQTEALGDAPRAIIKAKTFELIAEKSRIAIDKDDIFQDKLFSGGIISAQRYGWQEEILNKYLAEQTKEMNDGWSKYGSYQGMVDFGHTSPNSRLLMEIGFVGLLERIKNASGATGLSQKQRDFYTSCEITLKALIRLIERLAEATQGINPECSEALYNLTRSKPNNIYEAMQAIIIYFFFHEYVGGTRVRTLGRLDVLLYPFYKNDIENGTFTKQQVHEQLKFFLSKFWSAKVPFDLPFCLGGCDADGNDVTNEISYMIVEAYNELDIYSPKIHIRVSDNTPKAFIKLVLSCIRNGNSSFVFVNDKIGINALKNVGINERDARDYVPIGCYEPAVWGVEIGCTGNGGVNLAKAVELVFTNGRDNKTNDLIGVQTGKIESFEAFVEAVCTQIRFMTDRFIDYVSKAEGYYGEINPDPLLSCMYDKSVEQGIDVYEGGAKYNNSSIYYWSIATLVDSMAAVKKLVFDDRDITFEELAEALKNNWSGYESLRLKAKNKCGKYGTGDKLADELAVMMSDYISKISTNRPNGRGGVFKAALFTIDHYVHIGGKTMATPDGRFDGDILSKNLCATVGMDKNGITALINSVTKMDLSRFPTGSVLDIIVHPSAVMGEDGLEALYHILQTYFSRGGFAMHGNIFNPKDLRAAQKNPEKYKNLQVRVCGWNAYFVNLSKVEQDAFILQAESVL